MRTAAHLNSQLDLDKVILAVCQEAVEIFGVSQAAMSLHDARHDLLVYAGGVNVPPEMVPLMEPMPRAQFDEMVQAIGPIVIVPDVQSIPGLPNVEINARQDIRTVVACAMFRDDELVGALTLGTIGRVRQFTTDELTLLKALSDQAAQAIMNAQLLRSAKDHSQQLGVFTTRFANAIEAERRNLARELHDEIGQALTAVKINLQAIAQAATTDAPRNRLEENIEIVSRILQQVRDLSLDLHPSLLDDLGLVPALRWYVDRIAQRAELNAEFIADNAMPRPPTNLETTCFRISQEALTNIQRHARAKRVRVELRAAHDELQLTIQDDGIGFDTPAAMERAAGGMSLGLLGMQERAELAGGRLEIESALHYGTRIRAVFPLPSLSQHSSQMESSGVP